MNLNKINGYGSILRFITPILITIMLFIVGMLRNDMLLVKTEAKANFDRLEAVAQINFDKIDIRLSNHLSHHQIFDKEMIERLTRVETKISNR